MSKLTSLDNESDTETRVYDRIWTYIDRDHGLSLQLASPAYQIEVIMFGYEKCGCVESESKRCVDIRLLWFMVKASTRVREYDNRNI